MLPLYRSITSIRSTIDIALELACEAICHLIEPTFWYHLAKYFAR